MKILIQVESKKIQIWTQKSSILTQIESKKLKSQVFGLKLSQKIQIWTQKSSIRIQIESN